MIRERVLAGLFCVELHVPSDLATKPLPRLKKSAATRRGGSWPRGKAATAVAEDLTREILEGSPPKSIVQANQDILDIRFGAENAPPTGGKGRTLCAEAHEIVFDKRRPVRCEHPFAAAADCPARTVVGDFADLRSVKSVKGYICIGPRRATLHIKQDVRCHEVTAASRQRIEPARATVGSAAERYGRKRRVVTQACRIEHIANAKHPCARLVIAADLTATRKTAIAC